MRAVVQRVTEGEVSINGEVTGKIDNGLVVLLGVEEGDTSSDVDYMAEKISGLRVFEDEQGKMNLSISEKGGCILAVSQFTLLGDVRKGKRPGFSLAAKPEDAKKLYDEFTESLRARNIRTEEGVFQAEMLLKIYNDGPVTILIDSKKLF